MPCNLVRHFHVRNFQRPQENTQKQPQTTTQKTAQQSRHYDTRPENQVHRLILQLAQSPHAVADLEGAEPARPPPLGRRTDVVTHGHVS